MWIQQTGGDPAPSTDAEQMALRQRAPGAAPHRGRCVSRTEHDGLRTVLASHHEGRRLNSPEGDAAPSEIGGGRAGGLEKTPKWRGRRRP